MIKNIDQIKERYLKEPLNMRIGHLASDLNRIATFSDRNAIKDIIEESKFFIEWTATYVSFDIQALLSGIQSKLALCGRHITEERDSYEEIKDLKEKAKIWSGKLLELSGILAV